MISGIFFTFFDYYKVSKDKSVTETIIFEQLLCAAMGLMIFSFIPG